MALSYCDYHTRGGQSIEHKVEKKIQIIEKAVQSISNVVEELEFEIEH